ncbi:hypothetical protein NG895_27285 [Aeoliella sp. ICT_H6.2]|uniref:Uncharacterized protein n=1 Tax=Aeoliella straminimaris TaxID=2954799 RepID=A0A9X2FEM1_9BACT|nr:hypothetical protein [Aeoliella straminimaris]MCO6047625.1 hypothetical protein [Aeoliella straminimaris]
MRTPLLQLLATAVLLLPAATLLGEERPQPVRADIGFGDHYKVGCWTPLRISVLGGEKPATLMAEVRVPDGEGTLTSINSRPFSVAAGAMTTVEMLVRIGQLESSVEVLLRDAQTGKVVGKRTFVTHRELDKGGIRPGDPATTRLLVVIADGALGVATAEAEKSNEVWFTQDVVGRVTDLSALPREALAYEGVDTVVVSTSDREAWSSMRPDDPRIRALVEWVQQGGRLLLYSAANADLVLGAGGPLEALVPGEYVNSVTLDEFGALETYVGGNEPLSQRGRLRLAVPTFANLRGDVELSLGTQDNPVPLVIRAREGLGQVVLVGLDVDLPPIKTWKSRERLVAKNLAFPDDEPMADTENYYYSGPDDIVVALEQQLDKQLEQSGIRTPPFMAIAGLVVLYILLIGPGDYFFVQRVLKKMEWTWVTFPTIVVVTCLAAYWYANYLKGDSLRVNQVEVVDIDNSTGFVRGTMWTHVFSPNPDRYTLSLEAKSPAGSASQPSETSVAWLGKPSPGLGGMSNEQGMLPSFPVYGWSLDRAMLDGTPIEIWSTKTFVTRWQAETDELLISDLTRTANKLVVGSVQNPTELNLSDCMLVYGTWAWRLGDLPSGGTVEVKPTSLGDARAARRLRNLYEDRFNFNVTEGSYYERQQLLGKLDLAALAEMMMFYDALGGRRQSHQWHRHQHFVDLSRSLDADSAMLVGKCDDPRSELLRGEKPDSRESMRGDKDVYVVLYRYVLDVQPESDDSGND